MIAKFLIVFVLFQCLIVGNIVVRNFTLYVLKHMSFGPTQGDDTDIVQTKEEYIRVSVWND